MLPISSSRSSLAQSILQRVQSQLAGLSSGKVQPVTSKMGGSTPAVPQQSQFMRNYYSDSFEPSSRGMSTGSTQSPMAARPTSPTSPTGSTSPVSSTSPSADPDAVAQQIAQEATGWTYDHSGGKTWSSTLSNEGTFDGTKSGVCADMAVEAAQRFEEQGVNARVVFGRTQQGNHAWVEYQNANGDWQMFDPTAAACTKNAADAITPQDNGLYGYGSAFDYYEAPAEN
jgi:hypothetical protein